MYDRNLIDEIKERLDIVEVIGRYVALQKTGQRYRGLCPFHQEKTPSFIVYPDRNSWHCYGACSTGGDIISFVQKKENLDFGDAVRMLAGIAGVELRQSDDGQSNARTQRLRHIHELAANFFREQLLHSPQAQMARTYLQRRGLSEQTLSDFHIGFAPDSWDALIRFMAEHEIGLDDLETAGLIIRREAGRAYDRFRNRVIIPIRDVSGRVIGFGGRVLDDSQPKYLNSPQTPLFDKSRVIFALDKAKRSIRARDQAVLVEGYMDVISAHQNGYDNVVAVMGTAITPIQLQTLARHSKNLIFALDSDAAGLSATIRSLHVARETLSSRPVPRPTPRGRMRLQKELSTSLKVALLPSGQDPDDVLRNDPSAWEKLIAEAMPLVDFFFSYHARQLDMTTAMGKSEFASHMVPLIAEIADPIEQRHYVSKLAMAVGVGEQAIDAQLEQYRQRQSMVSRRSPSQPPSAPLPALTEPPPDPWADEPEAVAAPPLPAINSPFHSIEERILVYIIHFPHLLAWADGELAELSLFPLSTDDFLDTIHRAIFDVGQKFLYSVATADQHPMHEALDETLRPSFNALLAQGHTVVELREDQLQKDIVDLIIRLRKLHTEKNIADLNLQLRDENIDDQERHELLDQISRYVRQLNQLNHAISSRSHTEQWLNGKRFRPLT